MGISARYELKKSLQGHLPMKIVIYHQHIIAYQKQGYMFIHIFTNISIHKFTVNHKVFVCPFAFYFCL